MTSEDYAIHTHCVEHVFKFALGRDTDAAPHGASRPKHIRVTLYNPHPMGETSRSKPTLSMKPAFRLKFWIVVLQCTGVGGRDDSAF